MRIETGEKRMDGWGELGKRRLRSDNLGTIQYSRQNPPAKVGCTNHHACIYEPYRHVDSTSDS
mgnify:CR=1 FL=1